MVRFEHRNERCEVRIVHPVTSRDQLRGAQLGEAVEVHPHVGWVGVVTHGLPTMFAMHELHEPNCIVVIRVLDEVLGGCHE